MVQGGVTHLVGTPKAIVLGSYVNALAVTRSLGRRGIYVAMVSHVRRQVGSYSKYVREFCTVPDPYRDETGLHDLLMARVPEWQGAIIIPTDDFYVDILSRNKAELSGYYVVATADQRAIEIIQNKRLSYGLAMTLGIPAPKTLFPENPENVYELAEKVTYPCILKAYEGHRFKRNYPRKVIEVDSPARLCTEYEGIFRQHPLMIQEIVQGDDSKLIGYAAYYDLAGRPVAEFTKRKIRQSPPLYGNGCCQESIDSPEIVSLSRKMLKELDYRGSLVATEFKYDDSDGQLKFIEINARSAMSCSLAEASGVNLPWIMYQDLVLGKKVSESSQEVGVFWIHERADTTTLLRAGTQGVTIREYFSPYFSKKVLAVLAHDDIWPAVMDWAGFLLSSCTYPIRWCLGLIGRLRNR
jgi:D-aspartate ligase